MKQLLLLLLLSLLLLLLLLSLLLLLLLILFFIFIFFIWSGEPPEVFVQLLLLSPSVGIWFLNCRVQNLV